MGFNPDPLTEVYQAILQLLKDDPDVSSIVAIGNLIDRTSSRPDGSDLNRPKEDLTDMDLPEIDLVPAGGTVDIPNTSSSIVIDQSFDIVIKSATARLDAQFFPLFFAIIRAFVRVGCQMNKPELVERVSLSNYTDDENLDAVLKGLEGWSSLLTVNVKIRLKKDALK